MAILSSQATRRDAKSYFGRFARSNSFGSTRLGKPPTTTRLHNEPQELIHTALVKLCLADPLLDDEVLSGLTRTFVQLGRLGMPICVIVEPDGVYHDHESDSWWNSVALRQFYEYIVYRISQAIEAQGGRSQPIIGELLTQVDSEIQVPIESSPKVAHTIRDITQSILRPGIDFTSTSKHLLYSALKSGQIPVIAPVVGGIKPSILPVSADCIIYRICKGLATLDPQRDDQNPIAQLDFDPRISIERVIIIDPAWGLPATERLGGSHVYINLQQEYDKLVTDLSDQYASTDEISAGLPARSHLRNLVLANMCLALLSPTSSALITTPAIAAATPSQTVPQSLIHNLLTDKPLISPSLPVRALRTPTTRTTLLRYGLPIRPRQ
jgi:amino-acid N-acetyltransferase